MEKNLKVELVSKVPKNKELLMKTLANKTVIEPSTIWIDFSESLLNKIDLFLSNTNLDKNQQEKLIKLLEESYSEGYVNSMTD